MDEAGGGGGAVRGKPHRRAQSREQQLAAAFQQEAQATFEAMAVDGLLPTDYLEKAFLSLGCRVDDDALAYLKSDLEVVDGQARGVEWDAFWAEAEAMRPTEEQARHQTEDVEDAFAVLCDGAPGLPVEQFVALLTSMGDRLSREQAREVVKDARAHSGLVTAEQFLRYVHGSTTE